MARPWRAGMVNSNASTVAHRAQSDLILQPPLAEVDMLCDRIILINKGQFVEERLSFLRSVPSLVGTLDVAEFVDVRTGQEVHHLQGQAAAVFNVGTLFQPERAALAGRVPPIVRAFVAAVRERSATRASANLEGS